MSRSGGDEIAEQHHALLFQAHPDPLCAVDAEGRFVGCNRAFERLVGHTAEELRTVDFVSFLDPQDEQRVAEEFARALTGEVRSFDILGVDQHGAPFHADVTNIPVEEDGAVVRVFGVVRDVSARSAAQAALETSERRFRGLFEGAGAGIAITDLDGRFQDANPSYLWMLGYTLGELVKRDIPSITHPDDRAASQQELRSLLDGEVPSFVTEKRYLTDEGDVVSARVSASLIRDADGQPMHVAMTTEDITAARSAEERLRRSEGLRRLAGELALVGGWAVDAADGTVYWSEEIFRILDAPPGPEPTVEEILALYPPGYREPITEALTACLSDGEPFDLDLEIDTFAGRRIPVRVIAEAQRDEHGAVTGVFGAFQDVSDLRRATLAAEAAARRWRVTLESMTDAFYTVDRQWRFTYVNARAGEVLQRDPAALLGQDIWEQFPEAVGGELYEAYRRAVAEGETQTLAELYYPPLDTWFSVDAYPSEQGLAVYFRDVSQSRSARLEREEREATLQRQADLLDAAQDAILVRDIDHRITYWNRGAERIYGWSAGEAVGADMRELLHEDTGDFDSATAEVLEHGAWSGELVHRSRDGEAVVTASSWTLVRDQAGQPEAILSICTDITEQKRTEQHLLRAQRMESIGTLAGGVAHDLNNVLAPILLAADLLELQVTDEQAQGLLETIATSARRGADLVAQVLSFARGVEGRRTPVDVAAVVEEVRAIVRDTFPKDITLDVRVADDLDPIRGDSTQIQQVVLNLAVNARDAMPDGGRLTITAAGVSLDEQYVAAIPVATAGDHVRIDVEDDGIGMSTEVAERVFEPFFTTKPHGSGTGLGLSTSAAIVRSHGGFLQVYSEPGRGSRFRVYLPTHHDGAGARPDPSSAEVPRGDREVVLVVDDEAAIRTMTRQTLEANGYRVLEACDGAEAVAIFADDPQAVDVVLTDMMMPVMDGPAAVRALQEIDAEVRIVAASGLPSDRKVAEAAGSGVDHFLSKPYTSRSLLEALRDVLADG